MTQSRTDNALEKERRRTARVQSQAADPESSAWVAANAGTGKTHVLTERVLRILLKGTRPARILCLTYTKAAAAEMSTRVFTRLSGWVTAEPAAVENSLSALLGRKPDATETARARTLFATAIETPGGLKVQTIHAFCEQLLQRFPLEAQVPPGFEVLDEEAAGSLRREAIDAVLITATRDRKGELGRALTTAVAYAAEEGFDDKLRQALMRRDWIEAAQRLDESADDAFAAAGAMLESVCGVRAGATREAIEADVAHLLSQSDLARLRQALAEGSTNDLKMAEAVAAVIAAQTTSERVRAYGGLLMTAAGEPKAERTLATKGVQAAHADVLPTLLAAQDRFVRLDAELKSLDLVTATLALLRLADAVLAHYVAAKARRAGLDFEDLIARTAGLLRTAEATEWVLYKLDGGLDHILVDESQDTSPTQWGIIEALASEFYAGTGQREERRSVFAVGDEKQSIYSFQGAAPEKFAEMGRLFAEMSERAGLPFAKLPLTLSFRTVSPLLEAVDQVFASSERTPGVGSAETPIRHIANRAGHAGLVEVWPTETWAHSEASEPWSPLAETSSATPVARLADRIGRTIQDLIGQTLPSQNRPIRAGDILVLVRRRRPFAPQMVATLKAMKINVAGSDRIRTTEQLAVEDLIALGDFLVLPEDDLALATVLKSPLIGFDDDDLIAIAPERRSSLWFALLDAAPSDPRWQQAADQLRYWRRRADLNPPFEFYAGLLERDGGRSKLLSRLGPEAADPIDEFLNLALAYDEREPPSLVGFLHWLRASEREIKRDMEHGRDEVRIMTVHGAKGLEAPIVFLPDTCASPAARIGSELLTLEAAPRSMHTPPPFIWPVKGTSKLETVRAARGAIAAREREEFNRLLYVAMTRPRDRLYVAGFEGRRGRAAGCWYDIITDGLKPLLTQVETPAGPVLRVESPQIAAPEQPRGDLTDDETPLPPPAWATRRAPREPHLAVPVAPSRFVPYDTDTEGDPVESDRSLTTAERVDRAPPELSPMSLVADNRFLRGTLTHALLEHLPAFPPAEWTRVAQAFVAARGSGLATRQRASIVKETLAVLQTPDLALLYGPHSRAEVPIAATIASPDGRGPALMITGQIDRLADTGSEVLIVDYKTNRPPPAEVSGVAEAYLYQLAAYRLAVQQIFPGKSVRAAILWTDGPRMMAIPGEMLDTRQSRLWDMHPALLDADTQGP
jgi:ATP-dependent helicase/nuclease subunit A